VVAGTIAGAGGGIEAHGAQPIKASTRTAAMAVGRRRHENAKGTRRTPGSRCVERGVPASSERDLGGNSSRETGGNGSAAPSWARDVVATPESLEALGGRATIAF
jgi:hypothetical protein